MRVRSVAIALAGMLGLAALVGCGGYRGAALRDAMEAWERGDRERGLELARARYRRFREANELDEAAIRGALDEAVRELRSKPVVVRDQRAPPEPGDGERDARGRLARGLRRNLGGDGATAALRATRVVAELKLRQQVPELFELVFASRPLEPDDGVLGEHDRDLRTLVVKRSALDALEALRSGDDGPAGRGP